MEILSLEELINYDKPLRYTKKSKFYKVHSKILLKEINFNPVNDTLKELIFIVKNGKTENNKCLECKKKISYFSKYCSLQCQMKNNNKHKSPKYDENITENELKKILKSLNKNRINQTNEVIMKYYFNIPQIYPLHEKKSIAKNVYLFTHDIYHRIKCKNPKCNNNAIFNTIELGFRKFCSEECAKSEEMVKQRIVKSHFKRMIEINAKCDLKKCNNPKCNKLISVNKEHCSKECYNKNYNLRKENVIKGTKTLEKKGLKRFQSREMKDNGYYNFSQTPERRKMFEERGIIIPLEEYDDWKLYNYMIIKCQNKFNKEIKQLENYDKRGKIQEKGTYHLDHKFSRIMGFRYNILPYYIGHICNLEMIPSNENASKNYKCSLSQEDLYQRIENYNFTTLINDAIL